MFLVFPEKFLIFMAEICSSFVFFISSGPDTPSYQDAWKMLPYLFIYFIVISVIVFTVFIVRPLQS